MLQLDDMDESVQRLSYNLAHSNPLAMEEMKKMLWKGTENWDQLLLQRAAISGKLVLGAFTKMPLNNLKQERNRDEEADLPVNLSLLDGELKWFTLQVWHS